MKLALTHLKDGENQFQGTSSELPWVRDIASHLAEEGYVLESPLSIDLKVHKHEPDYYLRGEMAFKVRQICARCAENFPLTVKHRFDVALAHVDSGLKQAQNSDESEELDICFFDGKEIDLAPILSEQFSLSLPYQSVCQADCQGICQYCGQNKNLRSCQCVSPEGINPFSALTKLKV